MRGTEPRVRHERGKDAHRAKSGAGKNRAATFPPITVYLLVIKIYWIMGWFPKRLQYTSARNPAGNIARNQMYKCQEQKGYELILYYLQLRDSIISYLPLYVELTLPISLHHSFLDFGAYQTLTWLFQVLDTYFPKNKIVLFCFQIMKERIT